MSGKPVVIVTGCSSGLGLALAKRLVREQSYRLVVTARKESLHKIAHLFQESESVMLAPLDIKRLEEVSQVVNGTIAKWGQIDVLVNNAGICFRGVVEHMDSIAELQQLETNYLGPMNLIRAVLPIMREQGRGKIINVSSVSGILAMPTMASYSASKHALEGASEALWYEAKPYGIDVTLIQPGFIRSRSFQKVIRSSKANLSLRLKGPHSEYYMSMTPMIESMMRLTRATPESIARKIEDVIRMKSPPLRMRVTGDAHVFHFIRRLLPSGFFHRIMFRILPGSRLWGLRKLPRRSKFRTVQ